MEFISLVAEFHTQRFERACARVIRTLDAFVATLAEARMQRDRSHRQRVRERRARNRDRERARLLLNARRGPRVATLDRAAGTATVAGVTYRVHDAGMLFEACADRSARETPCWTIATRGTWVGEFACDGRMWTRAGGRTSQRRRRWLVLSAIAREWLADDRAAARGGERR